MEMKREKNILIKKTPIYTKLFISTKKTNQRKKQFLRKKKSIRKNKKKPETFTISNNKWNIFRKSSYQTQLSIDEQIADIPNESTAQKFIEEQRKGWIQPGDERQPKIDVKLELAKLNFCE